MSFGKLFQSRKFWGVAAAFVSVALWSFSPFIMLIVNEALSPLQVAGLRGFIATPVVLIAMWVVPMLLRRLRDIEAPNRAPWEASGTIWPHLSKPKKAAFILVGMSCYAFSSHSFVYATRTAEAGAATIFFFGVSPIVMVLVQYSFRGSFAQAIPYVQSKIISRNDVRVFTLLVTLLIIFSIGKFEWNHTSFYAALGTAIGWGVCVALTSAMSQRACYGTLALGTIATGCIAIPSYQVMTPLASQDVGMLVLLGVVALGLPLLFYGASMALVGRTSITMIIMMLQPIGAMFWIWLLANEKYQQEQFQWWHYLSAVLIILVITYYNIVESRSMTAKECYD